MSESDILVVRGASFGRCPLENSIAASVISTCVSPLYILFSYTITRLFLSLSLFLLSRRPPRRAATSKAKHLSLEVDVTSHVEPPRRGNLSGSRFPRVTLLPVIVGADAVVAFVGPCPSTVVKLNVHTHTERYRRVILLYITHTRTSIRQIRVSELQKKFRFFYKYILSSKYTSTYTIFISHKLFFFFM